MSDLIFVGVSMRKKSKTLSLLLLTLAVSHCVACAPIGPHEIAELRRPLDCQTADIDTHLLLRQRANVIERMGNGLLSITPPVVISDVVQGQYDHRLAVVSGRYNELIEHKIVQYYKTCGVRRVVRR